MRGFGYLTATVLVVIAICVAVVGGSNSGRLGAAATVSGRLVFVGGPVSNVGPHPLSGHVTFTGTGTTGDTFSVTTNPKGLWQLQIPPGTYLVSAYPYWGDGQICTHDWPVRLRAGADVNLVVACGLA
jgi:hypothetical protein